MYNLRTKNVLQRPSCALEGIRLDEDAVLKTVGGVSRFRVRVSNLPLDGSLAEWPIAGSC